jgi:AcrR family transcriptional regulator
MQRRSQETRTQIIKAALELFAQEGYEAASVSDISKAAGVSKGAFYHHFPSKQILFQQAMEEWLDSLDRQMLTVRETKVTVPEALTQMTQMMPDVYKTAMGGLPIFLEFLSHSYRDPEVLQAMALPHKRYQEFFASMIQDGIDEGSLRDVDPEVVSKVVVALAVGLLLEGLVNSNGEEWANVAQEGIKLLMESILRR